MQRAVALLALAAGAYARASAGAPPSPLPANCRISITIAGGGGGGSTFGASNDFHQLAAASGGSGWLTTINFTTTDNCATYFWGLEDHPPPLRLPAVQEAGDQLASYAEVSSLLPRRAVVAQP